MGEAGAGVTKMQVEHSFVETVCWKWYQSWAFPGISDATWGGPRKDYDWTQVDLSPEGGRCRQEAFVPAMQLYLSPSELQGVVDAALQRRGETPGRVTIDTEYKSRVHELAPDFAMRGMHKLETEDDLAQRAAGYVHLIDNREETTVIVSHGGPSCVAAVLCTKHRASAVFGAHPSPHTV
jgi:hypothetical protein